MLKIDPGNQALTDERTDRQTNGQTDGHSNAILEGLT